MSDYEIAREISPNNPNIYYAKGFTLAVQEDKKQEPIEAFEKAAKLSDQQNQPEYADKARQEKEKLE